MKKVLLLLSVVFCGFAQTHPRLLLDTAYKAELMSHVTANDATWTGWKADADYYLDKTVAPYAPGICTQTTQICFTGGLNGSYEGSGWYAMMFSLSLAYQLTGDTTYSNKVKEVITVMNASWDGRGDCSTYASTGTIPPSVDGGYGWRSFMLGFGVAYDWIHDQLSTPEKTAMAATAKCFYDFTWAKNPNGFQSPNAMFNYGGGFLIGAGAIAYAMQGEQTTADSQYVPYVETIWADKFAPAFQTGPLQGGCPTEGYNHYGFDHYLNILDFLKMKKTSGNGDAIGDIIPKMAKCMIYALQPSRWRTWHEAYGAMPSGVMWGEMPMILGYTDPTSTWGQYAQFFLNNLSVTPGGTDPKIAGTYFGASTVRKWNFLYRDDSRTAVDYRGVLPTYYDDGESYLFGRDDWTDNANWWQFTYSTNYVVSHGLFSPGTIKVSRGGDYLLINGQMWQGINGNTGSAPAQQEFGVVWRANALHFDDRGAYNEGAGTGIFQGGGNATSVDGSGRRMGVYAGVPSRKAVILSTTRAYAKTDLTSGYDGDASQQNSTNRTLRYWWRSFAWLGDGYYFVYDRVQTKSASPNYAKKMFWHFPPNTTPNWTLPTVTGNLVESGTVGSSRLVLDTVLPATASTVAAYDPISTGGTAAGVFTGSTSNRVTMRVEVSDMTSNTMNLLTVIAAIPSTDATPAHGSISTIDSDHVGAYITATAPRVAIFSADGSLKNSATFTWTHSGTAQLMCADLLPGTYTVVLNGSTTVASGLTVTSDNQAVFFSDSSSGGSYSVQLGGASDLAVVTTSLPGGVVGVSYSASLSASGGTSPYTWSYTGTICGGLSLSSAGAFSGTPTTAETCTLNVTVTDAVSATASRSLSITISPPAISITTTTIPGATRWTSYSQTFAATGGTTPYTWSIAVGDACGLALSSAGVLSGTPSVVRSCPIGVRVTDAVGATDTRSYDFSSVTLPTVTLRKQTKRK